MGEQPSPLAACRLAAAHTQESLAEQLHVSRCTIGRWERGIQTPQPWQRPDLAECLNVSLTELHDILVKSSLTPSKVISTPTGVTGDEDVSWMDRRDFLAMVTAATLGSGLRTDLDRVDQLLLTHTDPRPRSRIGHADLDAVQDITDGLRRAEQAHGAGLYRSVTMSALHQVRQLEDATCTDEVRHRLLFAISDLADVAGWMLYQLEDQQAARGVWTFALDTARRAENHPGSTDLAVTVLGHLVIQALHLNRPHEALGLSQLQATIMVNRRHPASPITQCAVLTGRGYCWAALGEIEPCRRDMGQEADDYPDAIDIAPPSHWTRHAPDTQIAAFIAEKQGNTLELLSRSHPEFAPAAIEQLRIAVDSYDKGASRARAVELPYLASAYFRTGDLDSAVATGHQALTAMNEVSSTLAYTELSLVDRAAAPFRHQTQVAELRELIREAVTATAS